MAEREGGGPNLDRVRQTMSERDEEVSPEPSGENEGEETAEEVFLDDPSRNPDDPNLDALRGG